MEKGVKEMSNHRKYKQVAKVVWDGKKGTAKRVIIDGKKQYIKN